jgi:flavin reductase (DIM6/NTAB) family NADH-FMN oxidoreductase RutF
MTISTDDFRSAMRHLAGHVCLITTTDPDGSRNGLTATAVCSVSAEPPTLLCSVFTGTACNQSIQQSESFAVNVLALTDKNLADRFAGPIKGEERFEMGQWTTLKTGAPVLGSALAGFDCQLIKTVEMNTHSILFGEIKAVNISRIQSKPLLYAHGNYGRFAGREAGSAAGVMRSSDWDFDSKDFYG